MPMVANEAIPMTETITSTEIIKPRMPPPCKREWIDCRRFDGTPLPIGRCNRYREVFGLPPLETYAGRQEAHQQTLDKVRTSTGTQSMADDAPWRTCQHRGERVRELNSASCGCAGLDRGIYECALGGTCMKQRATTLQREATVKAGIKLCDECDMAISSVLPDG